MTTAGNRDGVRPDSVTRPLVSCVIPVHNGERYLAEAIASILHQTYRSLELIVVDDGSTDLSASIAASYAGRITYVLQPHSGVSAARNRGIQVARGDLIGFLDADDLWHREKLARQVQRFEERPELDFCVTHVQNFWAPELKPEEEQYRGRRYAQPLPGYTCTSLLVRRGFLDQVGPFSRLLQLGEDNDWFLRAYDRKPTVELLPNVLVYRRIHRSNITRKLKEQIPLALLDIVKLSLDRRRGRSRPAFSGDAPADARVPHLQSTEERGSCQQSSQ